MGMLAVDAIRSALIDGQPMSRLGGSYLPRNLEFLFSRNRLSVAISRAQSVAVLIASPRLLEIRCNTIEQMPMVNALCRFVEDAGVGSSRFRRGTGTFSAPFPRTSSSAL